MSTLRLGWILALGLCVATVERVEGQTIVKQLEPFRKTANEPGNARTTLVEFRDGKQTFNKANPIDQAVFAQMGQYLVNRVTHHEFHATTPEPADLKPRPVDRTMTELVNEMHKFLIIPPADGKISLAQEEYIRAFGAALNKSLADIISVEKAKLPPAIIRVNAGRLLAVACESGAPAHWPTVIALLKNPETPPELFYYALKASEGLLGGFDVSRLSRLDPNPEAAEGLLADLVQILENTIVKGPPILGKLYIESGSTATLVTDPKSAPTGLHPEQIVAVQLYRLQAIRALARLRNDIIGGKVKPALEVRPVYTLARVAIGDPAITPAFSKREIAEAVIGMTRVNPGANLNIDELAYAVSFGTRVVFAAKAANADDTSIAWKGYSGRMNAAFQDWQANCAKNTRISPKQKDSINSLVKKAADGLFTPVLNPTAGTGGTNLVKLELITDWQRDNGPINDRQLFSDVKTYKLAYSIK